MKKCLIALTVVLLCLSVSACGKSTSEVATSTDSIETVGEAVNADNASWPSNSLTAKLPTPKSADIEIVFETSDVFSARVKGVTTDDFREYAEKCKEMGFTIDTVMTSNSFIGYNSENYKVFLIHSDDVLDIDITVDLTNETNESTADDTTIEDKETAENKVSSEFKELMDSYEEFFNEYVDFMKKYNNSSDKTSMLTDYADFMSKYADMMSKLNAIDEDELSEEDAVYYVEVSARITKKLSEVGASF